MAMSDLKQTHPDQAGAPSPRIRRESGPGADLPRFPADLVLAAMVLMSGCVTTWAPPPKPEPVPVDVWVDAFAAEGGDGSSDKPLRQPPNVLAPKTRLHVRSGLYAGPFQFSDGARVEGVGEVVFTGTPGQTTVTAHDAELVNLSVQGGDTGLVAGPEVVLRAVRFSGQRQRAVTVNGALTANDVTLVSSVEGIVGVLVSPGAKLVADDLKLEGGFRKGVECLQGATTLRRFSAQGAKAAVHLNECGATLVDGTVRGGSGPAVFAVQGTLDVQRLTVRGQEYGLQLAAGAKATVSGLVVEQTAQACVSSQRAELTLTKSELKACGLSGAVVLFESTATVEDTTISSTQEVGILIRQGQATLKGLRLSQISAPSESLGDALHVRQATVKLDDVRVSDVTGSALFVSAFAQVEVGRLEVERARQAALFVERHSKVAVDALLVRGGGGAVVVPDEASLTMRTLSVAGGTELPIYAECQQGASVQVGRVESTTQQLPSRCITPLR